MKPRLRLVHPQKPHRPVHTCLSPGRAWAPCLCKDIDPSDRPCVVCETRTRAEKSCPACRLTTAEKLRQRGVDTLSMLAVLAIELRSAGHADASDKAMRLHQRLAEMMARAFSAGEDRR